MGQDPLSMRNGIKKRLFSFFKYKKTNGLLENLIIKINSAIGNTYLRFLAKGRLKILQNNGEINY